MNVSAVQEFLLAFADDEHLMGQQHTEWIGVAPFLEEDLAFSSIAQDELGHAALLYGLVLELDGIEPSDTAIDDLAFARPGQEYRSCHLAERTTSQWSEALVRHWVYDTFEELRWGLLSESTLPALAAVTTRALREEAFHRRHADALLDELLQVPEARPRIAEALNRIAALIPGLCEPTAGEVAAIAAGVAADSTAGLLAPLTEALGARFGGHVDTGRVEAALSEAGQKATGQGSAGRTRRSKSFQPLMTRMREVLDYDPSAVW